MADRNEAVVREACEARGRGDVARMLEFIDPEPEWTCLNTAFENPEPDVRSPLTFSITQRDAVRRRCPMPAAGPARRDWSGGRRRARCPSMLRANDPAAAG